MTYQKAIDILTSQGKFYINLGLERVQKILEILDNPQKKLQFIHVAGTNGKGSVCAMLSSILNCTDKKTDFSEQETENSKQNKINSLFKVGLFTSPHVFEYTERVKINDVEIDKDIFVRKLMKIVDLAEKNQIHLTEFEILTVITFEYFAENNVDIVILETGLGGRLDATNIIEKNICSIITQIDLDHTERLGDTIEKIAYEKAGIIKENCPVIISNKNSGFEIVKKVADDKKSKIIVQTTLCHCEEGLALKGTYQQENLALVLKAIELLNRNGLNITDEIVESGLKNVKHTCRFEYLNKHNLLVDGAHNPNGTKVLRESLNHYFPEQNFNFIFGCLRNKDYKLMMKNLFTDKDKIYFYHFDNENSCSEVELAEVCEFNSKSFDEYKAEANTLTVVCGSFYMIKELLTRMGIK